MRWEGGIALLDRHLARLAASAAHFGFRYREHFVLRLLHEASGDFEGGVARRLRFTLGPGGNLDMTLEHAPLGEHDAIRRAALHPEPVEAGGPFWRHKTTRRAHYDGPLAWAHTRGADEAILVDARGHVVEGTRTTVWVEREGRLLTPPLSAGGLPAVYRAHLLATRPDAAEAAITAGDLAAANAIWLSNAVRGLFRVEEVGP
jgi:para-aminobenzoate synthetase/4-amino-4-deoxychorismate lyase